MKNFSGKVAAITGAGSGIGQATAIALAEKGCHLSLSDVNDKGLAQTLEKLRPYPVKVTVHHVDVGDRAAVYQYAEDSVKEHGKVNLIINNAGVGLGETVEAMSYENFEWLMNINFWGVVYGTKAFLPHLKQSGDGHVVNISSIFGIIGVPTQAAYNAAKFAVKGFTESLREELDIEGGCVSATCIHPGGVKTNIARNSRMGEMGSMSIGGQDEVADLFDRIAMSTPEQGKGDSAGAQKESNRVLTGADAVLPDTTIGECQPGINVLLKRRFR
jgi:NADP-dependent 3-hydroxy acid dehydrogenase YdfG